MTSYPQGQEFILEADGCSKGNPGKAGIGVVLKKETGEIVNRLSKEIGIATNNRAEYEALLMGLGMALKAGASRLKIRMDSELVVKQVKGEYRVKAPKLVPLFERTKRLLGQFESYTIDHVPREQNGTADALASASLKRKASR